MKSGSMIEESVMAGSTKWASPSRVSRPVSQAPSITVFPRPKAGNSPSSTEKSEMAKMPVRKIGTEMPSTLRPMTRRAGSARGRRAQ